MSEVPESALLVRSYVKSDEAFLYATWIQSLRYQNAFFRATDAESYYRTYRQMIALILSRPKVEVRILCLREDPDVILGYSILEDLNSKNVLHWMFLKARWRNIGLLRYLIPKKIEIVTHIRKVGYAIRSGRVIFNPFIF